MHQIKHPSLKRHSLLRNRISKLAYRCSASFFPSLSFLLLRYRYVTGLLTIEKIATIDKLKPINEKRQSVCTHAVHDNIVNPRLGRLVSTNLIIRDQLRLFRHTHAPTQEPGPWSYRYTRHVRTWLPISIICRRIGH